MRGAGKTYVGRMAAAALGGKFTDADDVFGEKTQQSVSDFVAANDWAEFRRVETEILREFVQEKTGNHVIALGGGVVESEESRRLLKEHVKAGGNVVFVTRALEDIEGYLDSIGSTAVRPKWGEDFADVFKRREPWYNECSSHEFWNTLIPLAGQSAEEHHTAMKRECERFFGFISGVSDNRPVLDNKTPTSFLSLTFPDVRSALGDIAELTEGADAIELRVDLLSPTGQAPANGNIPPAAYVSQQLSMLRLVSPLPIVYSVRTVDQGGRAPSDNADAYASLVKLGLRSACEYVDLEMAFPDPVLSSLSGQKGTSSIIASWHDWSGDMKWTSSTVQQKFNQCAAHGDIVKIVGTARSVSDNLALAAFVAERNQHQGAKPFLAINMGAHGQLSRILNPTLTPVTHAKMPSVAAPGQLTSKQVLQARHLMGLLPKKQFYLFGSPIGASVSPTLHNTGFGTLGLPHMYGKHETATVDADVERLIRSEDFGGASVTIPLKLAIMDKLDSVSEDAKVIGAVNTIIPRSNPQGGVQLHGDNTDWQAIREAAMTNGASAGCTGLVIGAGGTCRAAIYALYELGAGKILLFNRTRGNADTVAQYFGAEYPIEVIESLETVQGVDVVVSTVPGDSLVLASTGSQEGIMLPENVLSKEKGVAIDLAYKPRDTALVQVANAKEGWNAVTGVEILVLQGLRQFELWTGKKAPGGKIRQAVMAQYNL